jgi:hypothetical protein
MQRWFSCVKVRAMMMMRSCLVGMIFLCACDGDSSTDAGTDASGDGYQASPVCLGDFDCPNTGESCWFVIDGGCTVQNQNGVCLPFTAPADCTASTNVACGCDGTTISVCAPAGYVDRTSNRAGACPSDAGPGTDGGTDDAGTDDAGDASPE